MLPGDTILNSENLGMVSPELWSRDREYCPPEKRGLAEGVTGRYLTRMFAVLHPPIGPRQEERYA